MGLFSVMTKRLLFSLFILFLFMSYEVFALTPDQIYDRVKDSIIIVKTYDENGRLKGLGSGVMLPSGKFVTNHHVIKKGRNIELVKEKTFYLPFWKEKIQKKISVYSLLEVLVQNQQLWGRQQT